MFMVLLLQHGSHLNDVHRLLCVLLKKHHGGGIRVHVELLQQPSAVLASLVYVAKANKISEGKRRKLESRINSQAGRFTARVKQPENMFFKNIAQLNGRLPVCTHKHCLLCRAGEQQEAGRR